MDIESSIPIDLFVVKSGDRYVCAKCFKVLVTIEPGGLLGDELNQLDHLVIWNHNLSEHGFGSRLPKFSRTRKTAGGDPNQKGLAEVPEGNQVSAPAERGSDSVQSGPAPKEQASIEVRVVPATNPEPLRKPTDVGFSYWSD